MKLSLEISRLLGKFEGLQLVQPELKLRRQNLAASVHGSLSIEGNTLSLDQVTALENGEKVFGSQKEILEVTNALEVYKNLRHFDFKSEKSLLLVHKKLMSGLLSDAGKYRLKNVGIFQGQRVTHTAPQAKMVPQLISNLFHFLKDKKSPHRLIQSAVFHYEFEFIHPFSDGNGRMGRLWQTLILMDYHPLFEYLPIELSILKTQKKYYAALGQSDKEGESTFFIEYSLETIRESLQTLINSLKVGNKTSQDRLLKAKEHFDKNHFSRKDFLALFPHISTATASRDLQKGFDLGLLIKSGDKAKTFYHFK